MRGALDCHARFYSDGDMEGVASRDTRQKVLSSQLLQFFRFQLKEPNLFDLGPTGWLHGVEAFDFERKLSPQLFDLVEILKGHFPRRDHRYVGASRCGE